MMIPSVRYSKRAASIARAPAAGADENAVAQLGGQLLDPAGDLGEERVVQVVEEHADGLRAPAGQAAGHRVGPVAEVGGGLQHARAAQRADLRAVVHHERHERPRDAGRAGDIVHRGMPIADLDSHLVPEDTGAVGALQLGLQRFNQGMGPLEEEEAVTSRRVLGGAIALLMAVLVAGCGGSDSGSKKGGGNDSVSLTQKQDLTFAMVTHGDAGSFWSVVKKGAEQAGKDLGVKVQYSESVNDPQKQAQLIDAAISSKVDGLAVSAPNPDAIKGSLAKAKAAGIPVVTLNSGSDVYESLGAVGHFGQDESVAGRAVGQRIKQGGGKKVLCVIHEQGNIGLTQRCDGVKQGFGGNVDTLQVKGTADISTSLTEMKSKLQADKSYDWVVALNGEIAMAGVDAIKGASSQAKLATFDLSGDVIKAIQGGTIQFAVDQQQYLQGYLPIVGLLLYKTNANTIGGGMPVLTGPSFVDKANADTVAKLAEAGTR
jgi:simple sugar transport system substrate-binding protein